MHRFRHIQDADHLLGTAVRIQHTDCHGVEVEDGTQRVTEPLEEIADFEAGAENRHQCRHRLEPGPTPLLAEKEHDTLNEGADQVRDLTARGDVLVAIDVRREARYDKRADDTATGVNRHRQARPATGGDGDRTFHRVANDARIALRVIHDEDATREDRRQVRVVDGVPPGRIEVGRVAPCVHW